MDTGHVFIKRPKEFILKVDLAGGWRIQIIAWYNSMVKCKKFYSDLINNYFYFLIKGYEKEINSYWFFDSPLFE